MSRTSYAVLSIFLAASLGGCAFDQGSTDRDPEVGAVGERGTAGKADATIFRWYDGTLLVSSANPDIDEAMFEIVAATVSEISGTPVPLQNVTLTSWNTIGPVTSVSNVLTPIGGFVTGGDTSYVGRNYHFELTHPVSGNRYTGWVSTSSAYRRDG